MAGWTNDELDRIAAAQHLEIAPERRDGILRRPVTIWVVRVGDDLYVRSRCSTKWKVGPCWRMQKALDEQGVDYEVVKGPALPGKRVKLQRLSGQKLYPVIEFENGLIYREESKDMAATIRAGKLDEKRGAAS